MPRVPQCLPRVCHVFATHLPCVCPTFAPRLCHTFATRLPHVCRAVARVWQNVCHAFATRSPRVRHMFTVHLLHRLPRVWQNVCHAFATCFPNAACATVCQTFSERLPNGHCDIRVSCVCPCICQTVTRHSSDNRLFVNRLDPPQIVSQIFWVCGEGPPGVANACPSDLP